MVLTGADVFAPLAPRFVVAPERFTNPNAEFKEFKSPIAVVAAGVSEGVFEGVEGIVLGFGAYNLSMLFFKSFLETGVLVDVLEVVVGSGAELVRTGESNSKPNRD